MEEHYNHHLIEEKWQRYWEDKGYFKAEDFSDKPKYYILVMFPYPSGKIHMGHVRNYTIGDVFARLHKQRGFNVLHPMGWDSFGLPAENAAIENKVHPSKWTFENIATMRGQLKQLGFSYDWDREIATCHHGYYQWQQRLIIKLYEKGLVYRKKASVNWCPNDKTVLANEQVQDGTCWRCGTPVIQKDLDQWFLQITDYAEQLLNDYDKMGEWPERVINMQKNWIGRSSGLLCNFKYEGNDFPIYTTRPDTIFGVTYMAIAAEHPLVEEIIKESKDKEKLQAFVDECRNEDRIERTNEKSEKKGIFTGKYVTNPFTKDDVPLYIANFVLMEYGTGAIMAVPAHDQRDFMFAKKHHIPLKVVIQNDAKSLKAETMTEAFVEDGILEHSGKFSGTKNRDAIEAIIQEAEKLGIGQRTTNYRLKDWLISRQRYWGNPIPFAYTDDHQAYPLDDQHLPVFLPEDISFTGEGNPILTSESFNKPFQLNGNKVQHETDTMDTFVCSSWYFLRFIDARNQQAPFDKKRVDYWMPVDQYVGGIEHACMHLLYARFFHKALRDLGMVSCDEPFSNLLTQGMVVSNSYYNPRTKKYYNIKELGDDPAKDPLDGSELVVKIDKMSKSKRNGIDPEDMIMDYGADTIRLFCLFAAPPEKDLEWKESGVEGAFRFVKKLYRQVYLYNEKLIKISSPVKIEFDALTEAAKKLYIKLHKSIKKVTEDFVQRQHFNTGIAAMMELMNELGSFEPSDDNDFKLIKIVLADSCRLLFPIIPHVTEELHRILGYDKSIYDYGWPEYKEEYTKDDEVEYVFQVNGKIRAKMMMPVSVTQDDVKKEALSNGKIKEYVNGKEIIKVVIVPNKLVNIVIKG